MRLKNGTIHPLIMCLFIWLEKKTVEMIGLLQRVVIHRPIPTVVKDWILNYNTKHRSKKNAPFISGFRLFRYSRFDGMVVAEAGRWAGLPFGDKKLQFLQSRIQVPVRQRRRLSLKKNMQFQGYYAIIKIFDSVIYGKTWHRRR